MNRSRIISEIRKKKSFLCIGLDTNIRKIPKHIKKYKDPLFVFNREIIHATHDLCIAYKPNLAFYECHGKNGWTSLERTMEVVPKNIFTIADAKRGDIGNTSSMYADAFFSKLKFDAVTVNPYMGHDSIQPFLDVKGKWTIVLGLTSNAGSNDFQLPGNLYEKVIRKCMEWGSPENMMFVAGATHPLFLEGIRAIAPDHFMLVPGIGAQGGSLNEVAAAAMNKDCGLIVNASRSILYASAGKNFAEAAREEALKLQRQMSRILAEKTKGKNQTSSKK